MRLRIIGVLVLGFILGGLSPANAQERFGGLVGTVVDPSAAPVPGATITATNKASGNVRTAVSTADGSYRIPNLDPGRYVVSVELSGFQKAEDENVLVLLGRNVEFSPKLAVGSVTEVVNVTGVTPSIDPKSTMISRDVTAEEFDRLPKGRSFQSMAFILPSVTQGDIEGGINVNGASSAENSYTIDGVVTGSLINGRTRQNTVFEYLQEVQVKTTGVPAEYGGALGGVVSAVTKSGGNLFQGEAHWDYQGDKLSAGPVQRLVLNPSDDKTVSYVQEPNQSNYRNEVGGSLGGPIVRDHLFFFGSASPQYFRRNNRYLFSSGTDEGNIKREQTFMSAFGKVTYASGSIRASGSLLFTPTTSKGTLPAYNSVGPLFISSSKASNASQIARGFETDQTSTMGDVDITLTNSSFLSFRGGYFFDGYKDTGVPLTPAWIYQSSSVGLAGVPANLQGPIGTQNTPRTQISLFDNTKQGFFNIDYSQAFTGAGVHQLKAGFGFRRSINEVDSTYPGGYTFVYWDSSYTSTATQKSDRGTYGYYEVNDFGTRGKTGANILSLFVQDQWTLGPGLTLNVGVRTENEKMPTFRPDIRQYAFEFGFADKIAPRVGVAYDVWSDGRLKAFGSWGRYYDWTKYQIARGSFGGDFWHTFYRSLDDPTVVTNLSTSNMPGRDLFDPANPGNPFKDWRATHIDAVPPDIKPMYQDSISGGIEYQLRSNSVLSVNYVHNNLPRTIEDLSSIENGSEVYIIGNPGEGIAKLIFPSGRTPATYENPKPKRQYDALEIGLNRRFSRNWFGSANYVYSRLYGNYAGVGNSDEIRTPTTGTSNPDAQVSAGSVARGGTNSHRGWDVDELLWDSHGTLDVLGRLATDRPHQLKLSGSYTAPFGTQIGAFVYAASGTPISSYVWTTNQIPVFVEGRGDMGRTPMLSRTDLLVAHELQLLGRRKIRFELNVLNVFNQQTATHIFNNVNRGQPARSSSLVNLSGVDLSKGYDYRALLAATQDRANAYDPRFGQEDLFQTGTQGQFTVKFIF